MDDQTLLRRLRRSAPSWLMSLALHAAILVPLCLVTWVVGSALKGEQVITLSLAPDVGPAGENGDSDRSGGGDGQRAGAAGGGADDKASGPRHAALALLPPAPAWSSLPGQADKAPEASSSGKDSSAEATSLLIHSLVGREVGQPGGGGTGGPGFSLEGTGPGFVEQIGRLRGTGLDIVLVLDSTDSMSPYIGQAKQRLKDIVCVVEGLVPSANIGLVAYKDYGDDYGPTAVKFVKISQDHKDVKEFLDSVVAGGGGDEPEPIHEALKVATDVRQMGWHNGRKWVIILIGDSTIHPSGRAVAFGLARRFAAARGTINVIDTGGSGEQAQRREQVRPDLQTIAKEGGGSAFLLKDDRTFWQYTIVSIFGERFKNDVDVIIQKYVAEPQQTQPQESKP